MTAGMLATLGDLVEDLVVRLAGPINVASDTASSIVRRQGGSAATVALTAARLGFPARFLGQVGDDAVGTALVGELAEAGVDVTHVRRAGTTGTIVVLVPPDGERTMLTDRGSATTLDVADPAWLDGVETLHVPFYSLTTAPLSTTAMQVVEWAHERSIPVSIDLSSTAVLLAMGEARVRSILADLRPDVVLANQDEAGVVPPPIGSGLTVVKHGPDPVVVHAGGDRFEVAVPPLTAVAETTGAGDAFAAGFLTHRLGRRPGWFDDPLGAVAAGNRAAAAHLTGRVNAR